MKILNVEATYNRSDEPFYLEKAFKLAGFKKEESEEIIVDSKEVKYCSGDKIVRLVKFDPMSEIGGFYFQYHVMQLTEEDIVIPKKIYSSNVDLKKDTTAVDKSSIPIESAKPKARDSNNEESRTLNNEQFSYLNDESIELTGQELQDYLEANGQQSLF